VQTPAGGCLIRRGRLRPGLDILRATHVRGSSGSLHSLYFSFHWPVRKSAASCELRMHTPVKPHRSARNGQSLELKWSNSGSLLRTEPPPHPHPHAHAHIRRNPTKPRLIVKLQLSSKEYCGANSSAVPGFMSRQMAAVRMQRINGTAQQKQGKMQIGFIVPVHRHTTE
jgi:hypothetical protein